MLFLAQDVFEDNESIHLVMELCEGGALLERIERLKYSEAYISRIVRSILRFVSQCHAKGIIYRDIKVRRRRGRAHSARVSDVQLALFSAPGAQAASGTSRGDLPARRCQRLANACVCVCACVRAPAAGQLPLLLQRGRRAPQGHGLWPLHPALARRAQAHLPVRCGAAAARSSGAAGSTA